jgi:hypothetical protein
LTDLGSLPDITHTQLPGVGDDGGDFPYAYAS